MLPAQIEMSFFYQLPSAQEMLRQGGIPLALNKETTDVVGFNLSRDHYFVIGQEPPQQQEYVQNAILYAFQQLEGHYKRVVFNANDQFEMDDSRFDIIVNELDYNNEVLQLREELDQRLSMEEMPDPMLIYIPNTQNFANKSFISGYNIEAFLRKGYKAGMYFIFQGNQSSIE